MIAGKEDSLEFHLAGLAHLPQAPTLMMQLIELFQQPNRDIDEVVAFMRRDPALSAEVLRVSNSAIYGNEEPVADISEALFRVGFYEVYRLAVALLGKQSVGSAKNLRGVDIEKLWRHCAITAILGGVIARGVGESEGVIYTAGLLHDVGKVILATADGAKYTQLLNQPGLCGRPLAAVERDTIGFNHSEAGAWLLRRWQMPDEIAVPVLHHHDANWSGEFARAAALLNLADALAHQIEEAPSDPEAFLGEAALALEALELKKEKLAALKSLAEIDIKRLAPVLSFHI